jgi:hypothetical protein
VLIIAYIRFKVGDEMHKTIKEVCARLGLKESELSRVALLEYLRSMNVFEAKIRGKTK